MCFYDPTRKPVALGVVASVAQTLEKFTQDEKVFTARDVVLIVRKHYYDVRYDICRDEVHRQMAQGPLVAGSYDRRSEVMKTGKRAHVYRPTVITAELVTDEEYAAIYQPMDDELLAVEIAA
jgi:hypothetical protein